MDGQQIVFLVLLDLSAAFDTVDHYILLQRLQSYVSVTGEALAWFSSYLKGRKQVVSIDGVNSEKSDLKYGVPQGSVLGPILFSIYTLPLGNIIRRHNLGNQPIFFS